MQITIPNYKETSDQFCSGLNISTKHICVSKWLQIKNKHETIFRISSGNFRKRRRKDSRHEQQRHSNRFPSEDLKLSIETAGWIILTLRSFSSLNRPSLPLCLRRGGPSNSASAEDFLDDWNHKNKLVCYKIRSKILQRINQWRKVVVWLLYKFYALNENYCYRIFSWKSFGSIARRN